MKEHDATEIAFKNGYTKAAKDIFEEIENEINNELKNNSKILPQVKISNVLWNRISGRINTFQGILEFIAKLKKKYIKDCTTCKHLVSCEPNTSGSFECWEGE